MGSDGWEICVGRDRWLVALGRGPLAQEDLGTLTGVFSVRCSEIVVISVFRGSTPKARRETFVTTETSLGKPSRVPEDKCQPLFHLHRKNAAMEWDHECQKAFDTIKAYLIQPPILVPPVPNRPLILYLTVRRQSLGCMLGQEGESTRTERAIYYLSKKFTEGESNYPEIEKMCCVLGQAIADHLAEFLIDDDTPINTDFSDEGILQVDEEKEEPTWKIYFDGAVNSVGSGVGAVLISPDGRHYPVAAKVDFSYTNNTKDAKLVPYHEYLEELAKNFEKISFTYTPRAKNQFADALATLASMASISEGNIVEPLEIEVAKRPAHCNEIEASEAKPWYEDIKNFW
ncbi:hypothetical protein CRG98_011168 [Punica granatum]|uniref:Reverse transcriptase/retrotransposon-derived protein RNase H-like domain-containing protein n=1 Tax=Punica granatum TaxID=22663 RepID=A0A2I0KJR1_PUNGR|nr:hypothetical protein CRG98_011168 [Punica granatum]